MANIKPVVLVNRTNASILFGTTKVKADYRQIAVPDAATGEITVAAQPYEVRTPDVSRSVEVPGSLDLHSPGARPGYAVLKSSTYAHLTSESGGYPDFETTWANSRDGAVDVLKDEAAQRFVDAWDVDLKKEAM